MERFTSKASDYLVKDIRKTLLTLNVVSNGTAKKGELFTLLLNHYHTHYGGYNKFLPQIDYIQMKTRQYLHNRYVKMRGEGFHNHTICKNDNDFFSLDSINDIDPLYFFSYRDTQGSVWFFDIRSIHKLIEHNQANPYTREPLPELAIQNVIKLTKHLGLKNTNEKIVFNSRKNMIKQKTIDIFSVIEQLGYECHFDWFLSLSKRSLKQLYRNLEDIWNYRIPQLTQEMKSRIVPPHGRIFTTPVQQIYSLNNKSTLQDTLLNEISKFNNAESDADKKLGYMYFLIGLGQVCPECNAAHSWMAYV